VAAGWRILHNEELHNLYALPNIIRVINSGRMRWVGHVACIRERRNLYKSLVENPETNNHSKTQAKVEEKY
jgi:hypothetical protein